MTESRGGGAREAHEAGQQAPDGARPHGLGGEGASTMIEPVPKAATPAPGAPTPRVEGGASPGPLLVVVQGPTELALAAARPLVEQLRSRFAPLETAVLVSAHRGGEPTLWPVGTDGAAPPDAGAAATLPAASQGGVPGLASPLGPLLREGVARGASVMAVVAAEPHDEAVDWLDRLLRPALEGGYDFVCPAYRRRRTDGAINTGIVAPLVRTLYGQALRQPLGTEAAISARLAHRLVADEDWRRRPAEAGSDAWLIAKTLGGEARVAQAWLGAWPRPAGDPEELAETLVRALGLVFTEMERSADRWQRAGLPRPVPTFGEGGFEHGGEPPDPAHLQEAFGRGLRDLLPIWSLFLPPATLLALQRSAARPAEESGVPDEVWAKVVIDFAVAHMTRVVERRQLLRSLAPLYLGWLAGLARAAATLDEAGFEARVEATAAAFAREKRYLIARWRWPDEFNP